MLKSSAKACNAAKNIRAKRAVNSRTAAEGLIPTDICLWSWKVPEGAGLADADEGPAAGAESIFVPADAEFLAQLNRWSSSLFEATETKSAAEFLNILAGSGDSRLREIAAGCGALPAEAAAGLSGDPSSRVRRNLAENGAALIGMGAADWMRICKGDQEILESLLDNLGVAIEEAVSGGCPAVDFNALKRKAGDFAKALEGEEFKEIVMDINVFSSLCDFKEAAEHAASIEENDETPRRKRCMPRPRRRAIEHVRDMNDVTRDGFVYGIGFMNAGKPVMDLPVAILDVNVHDDIVQNLPATKSSLEILKRFARSPIRRVRKAVASLNGIDPELVRILKNDPAFSVRCDLLENSDALDELSADDIVELIDGDPAFLEEVFNYSTGSRMTRILEKAYEGLDDPFVKARLAKLRD